MRCLALLNCYSHFDGPGQIMVIGIWVREAKTPSIHLVRCDAMRLNPPTRKHLLLN